jgi:hypothetical protein
MKIFHGNLLFTHFFHFEFGNVLRYCIIEEVHMEENVLTTTLNENKDSVIS